ncbi:Asp23/Gls24 family envelope stress response protein [Streptomyces macrosporus]|uniref:Asp23/Gls24 family envelope stress response protein n=1 Tax=Streptomyces macrosporus TaxID=44032 RepID=A0ABN3KKJ8_9ACTN
MAQEFLTAAGSWVPAAERGATRITDRVIGKIASRAAREALDAVPEVSRTPRELYRDPRATATVLRPPDADGSNGEARVRVAIELPYPCDIGARCGAVRRRVASRVLELAGLSVRQVTVEVARLHSAPLDAGETGRVR